MQLGNWETERTKSVPAQSLASGGLDFHYLLLVGRVTEHVQTETEDASLLANKSVTRRCCGVSVILALWNTSVQSYLLFYLLYENLLSWEIGHESCAWKQIEMKRQSDVTTLTRGKVLSWEYRSPRKRNSRPPASVILCWVSWVENVLLIYRFVGLFTLEKIAGLRRFWTVKSTPG